MMVSVIYFGIPVNFGEEALALAFILSLCVCFHYIGTCVGKEIFNVCTPS